MTIMVPLALAAAGYAVWSAGWREVMQRKRRDW